MSYYYQNRFRCHYFYSVLWPNQTKYLPEYAQCKMADILYPKYQLPPEVRVNLGVMAMKKHSTLNRYPKQEPQNQMQFSVISGHCSFGNVGLIPLQKILLAYSVRPTYTAFYFWEKMLNFLVSPTISNKTNVRSVF